MPDAPRNATAEFALAQSAAQIEAAVGLLREASNGYLAVHARQDATLFDATMSAVRAAMRAQARVEAAAVAAGPSYVEQLREDLGELTSRASDRDDDTVQSLGDFADELREKHGLDA